MLTSALIIVLFLSKDPMFQLEKAEEKNKFFSLQKKLTTYDLESKANKNFFQKMKFFKYSFWTLKLVYLRGYSCQTPCVG